MKSIALICALVCPPCWLQSQDNCDKMVFVESPLHDAFLSSQHDSVNYGELPVLQLRGVPAKRSLVPVIGYQVEHIDPAYVKNCYFKIYTVSKKKVCNIDVFGMRSNFDEREVTARHLQLDGKKIASQNLDNQPFLEFDVTDFVKENLHTGSIQFYLQTDSKKMVEVASSESGLCPELIIEICSVSTKSMQVSSAKAVAEDATMSILPNAQAGKLTVELAGVPPGGFADVMIMNEHGQITRKVPLAIRDGRVLYHSIEYGDLIPGHYVALFRKGRVMIKNQFVLRPSKDANKLLEVEWTANKTKSQ
ncbi:MAG: hypothetical protein HKN87_12085 [Saprospiraceae bacterium]|nr:hypothetical protein [Saprospiraceae bacterium]